MDPMMDHHRQLSPRSDRWISFPPLTHRLLEMRWDEKETKTSLEYSIDNHFGPLILSFWNILVLWSGGQLHSFCSIEWFTIEYFFFFFFSSLLLQVHSLQFFPIILLDRFSFLDLNSKFLIFFSSFCPSLPKRLALDLCFKYCCRSNNTWNMFQSVFG